MFEDFTQKIRITRRSSDAHDLIVGFAHYFPLSYLPDSFWDVMALTPSFRLTDGHGTELPIHVLDLNTTTKTGALWFRDDKADSKKAYWIYFDSPTSVGFDVTGPFAATAVWSNYRDVIMLNENPDNLFFFNHKTLGLTGTYSANTGDHSGAFVDSLLEMKANYFADLKDSQVVFGTNSLDKFSTPVTISFAFKMSKLPTSSEHFFGNWRSGNTSQQPWRVAINGSGGGLKLDVNINAFFVRDTIPGELADVVVGQWYVVTIKFAGPAGIEIDINGIARAMGNPVGPYPTQTNSATGRTVGGLGTDSSDCSLSSVLIYNGGLNKAQRDQTGINWRQPDDFWDVLGNRGSQVCYSSDVVKKPCYSSLILKNLCFSSHIKK